ncbi:MAG: hypothetical protein GVY17_01540 [Cyanobacteria bacterium]|jgi:hypothetical protein|nr:hypothetical protein [Cyanobacteria bacterium GSL.Bin21]
MAIIDNRTLLFIQSGATIESGFRERYSFTPTPEQIDTLHDADCAAVFSQLNDSWQGIDTLAQKIELSEKRVTHALKQLSQTDLAMGSENAWLRNFSLDDVEQARLSLLDALNEPMMVNDWMQRFDIAHRKPFQPQWNAIDLQAAIALLIQEGLIEYDSKTGQYERQVEVQEKDSQSVTLGEIRIDGGTQPRTELNQAIIAEYGELLAQGAQFPAITVYFDGVNYWLADGFHRYWAAKQSNTELAVNLIEGSQRDAILHSVGANANHGLRRSNEDKRKAVTTLLLDEEWCQWSDRAIARQCQVSDRFVNKIRKELSADHSICEYSQMKANHTRKVKRGEQVYEQLQQAKSSVTQPKPTDVEEKPMQRPSIIPEVHPEVHDTICRFLDLEAEAKPNQFVQSHDRAYLIANENPDEFDLMFERLFAQLEGQKINSAIAVTPNQAGPQRQIKVKASAVCLVSNSQCLCHRAVWYFGKQKHRFYSRFEPFGLTLLFRDEEVQE